MDASNPIPNLTNTEKATLRAVGKFGHRQGEEAWDNLVDNIKAARGGEYPPDWFRQILQDAIGWGGDGPPLPNPPMVLRGFKR